jgi:peptidoglycan/xylan/chitin deacetylase (PgdA/CDA1 family)
MPEVQLPLLPLVLDDVPLGLRLALAQEGIPCQDRAVGMPEGRFVLYDSRRGPCRWKAPGQVVIDVERLRAAWPADPFAALTSTRARRQQWEFGGLQFTEVIATVDKRVLREQLMEQLRAEIELADGVWLRVAAYPFPYRSALNFRIDYDEYQPERFQATMAAIAGHESSTSHYVNGSAYRDHPEAIARLRGLDVGSHGYWHHTYRSFEENLRNLRRGIEVLRAARIEPLGFVAPHGRFNGELLSAMERLGITHSSEFALAYDELPFYLGRSRVLQVPIHPVCFEIMLEALPCGATIAAPSAGGTPVPQEAIDRVQRLAVDYFREAARTKYRNGDPLFFYGHPTGAKGPSTEVVRSVLAMGGDFAALWKTTLRELAAWWQIRSGVRFTVIRQGDEFVVETDGMAGPYRIGVEYLRGRHVARMPLGAPRLRFSPSALAYEVRGGSPGVRPVRAKRPDGWRARLQQFIDWERVTPVEEIVPNNWRNLAKRALRTLS